MQMEMIVTNFALSKSELTLDNTVTLLYSVAIYFLQLNSTLALIQRLCGTTNICSFLKALDVLDESIAKIKYAIFPYVT